MKIATFNVNNINNRLANLLAWLRSAKPDVVALQELKAPDAEFPKTALEKAGYGAVWRGEKSWNGVAILARGCEPILTRTHLPGEGADAQSRYIEAAVRGVLITSVYAPNGNPQPAPNSRTSSLGCGGLRRMPRVSIARESRWCWRATTMSCRPTAISIRPSPMRRMRCFSRKAARCFSAFSTKAGSTRSEHGIQTRRCTRSGTTCEIGGRAMRGCASTTCC